jgi:hypothetical protein
VYSTTDIANQLTDTYSCSEAVPSLQTALCIAEIVMLAFTLYFAYSVRSLPGAVNESYTILAACTVIGIVGIAAFMAIETKSIEPVFERFLVSILFAILTISTPCLLYGRRVSELLHRPKVAIKKNGHDHGATHDVFEEGGAEKQQLVKAARDALKKLKAEEDRAQLCADQISFWYGTLNAISAHQYESHESKSNASASEAKAAMDHSRNVSKSLKDMKVAQKKAKISANKASRVSKAGSSADIGATIGDAIGAMKRASISGRGSRGSGNPSEQSVGRS